MAASSTNCKLPLDGVRIVSFEQFGAGPWATMQLADMGAEIIKVEDPVTGGDIARGVHPYAYDQDSVYFQSFNRNKKSITLDMRRLESKKILHRIVKSSDGVFNNLRGDVPSKLGIDYDTLGIIKPSVVCCSLSAFGRNSSRSSEPGYDYIMQAYGGWMTLTGEPDSPPQKTGLSMVDFSGGMMAALGMVSAILRAKETGIGCDVDVSLFDNAIAHLSYIGAWHLTSGYKPKRFANSSHPSQVPSQVLPTSDGWIVIMCAKEKFYKNLVHIMGVPELAEDPRFESFQSRVENREALVVLLENVSRTKTTDEWLAKMRGQVPSAPVNSVDQALRDPLVAENEMVLEIEHDTISNLQQLASPIKISDSIKKHKAGPKLGENTKEVLGNYAGATEQEIADWQDMGVV